MWVSVLLLKTIRCFPIALQMKPKLFTRACRPCTVWLPPIPSAPPPSPNLILFHSPARYSTGMLASCTVPGHTASSPAQGFHPCCSPCFEPCPSCSLHSWLLLLLQVSAHVSLLRERFPGYPSALPPVTSVTSPGYSHCIYHALKLSCLYTCLGVYILSASQKCKLHETRELSDHYYSPFSF